MTFLVLYVITGLLMLAFFMTSGDEISAYMDEVRRRLRAKREPDGEMSLGASLLLITLGWPYVLGALLVSWWVLRKADFIDRKRAELVEVHRRHAETMAEIERCRAQNTRESAVLIEQFGADAAAVLTYSGHLDDKAWGSFVESLHSMDEAERQQAAAQFIKEAHAFVAEMESRG